MERRKPGVFDGRPDMRDDRKRGEYEANCTPKGDVVLCPAQSGTGAKQEDSQELPCLKELKGQVNCQFGSGQLKTNGANYAFFLQWHVTEKCNLKCRHCYQWASVTEMGYKEICRAIDRLSQTLGYWVAEYQIEMSPSIHFTGGEPFLRDDLFDLLDYAREKGFSTSLLSNGTLITGDVARRIQRAGVQDVQISLDGTEPVHDSLRGDGAFARALVGIRNLIAQGIDTSVNMTVSSLNHEQVVPLLQLAEDLGVSAVTFSRLVPCGRGMELSKHLLTPEQLPRLYQKLQKSVSGTRVALISRDPLAGVASIAADEEVPEIDFPVAGCAAGIFGVTIAADGSIMPCRRMNLAIGNIRVDSFRRLWMESPVLRALRHRQCYHGSCGSCRYWAICRGCRAIALADARAKGTEDYLGPDPQCTYYKPAMNI